MASAIDIGNVQQINPIHQSTYIYLIHPPNRFHQLSMCIVNLHFIGFDAFNQQLSVGMSRLKLTSQSSSILADSVPWSWVVTHSLQQKPLSDGLTTHSGTVHDHISEPDAIPVESGML